MSKKEMVRASYSKAAPTFDTIFDREGGSEMHLTLNRLFKEQKPPENSYILDVGCGTGISTLYLHDLMNGKGRFQGIDIAQGMIDVARQKAEKRNLSNCSFYQGDAENLNFNDETFDFVMSNMVYQYLPNQRKAAGEMQRVLKNGGSIALSFEGEYYCMECIDLLQRLGKENELPEVLEAWSWYKNTHRSVSDMYDMFVDAGFVEVRLVTTFEKMRWNTSGVVDDINAGWGFWKVGLEDEKIQRFFNALTYEIRDLEYLTFIGEYYYLYATKP